jgi:chromosome segregation ATPase
VNEAVGQEVVELQHDLEQYIDELEEVAGESATLQDEVALLQEELERMENAYHQARGVSAMLRRQVTELTARAEEDQQEMGRLQEEADTNTFHLHNEVEDLYSKCARLEGKLSKVVQEKEEMKAAALEAMQGKEKKEAKEEEQLLRACDEVALLKASNASLWARLEATQAELLDECAQKEAAQQEKESLAAELLSLQAASQDREEEMRSLRKVNARLQEQVEAMKEEERQQHAHAREIASLRRTTVIAPLSARPHQRPSSSSSSPSSCAEGPHALLAPPALASLPSALHPGPPARALGAKNKVIDEFHQLQQEKEEALDSEDKENMGDSTGSSNNNNSKSVSKNQKVNVKRKLPFHLRVDFFHAAL